MYTSLDKADMSLKENPEGRIQYIQTDHRTSEEIQSEKELSILFAVVRILNPQRFTEADLKPIVYFNHQSPPPTFLKDAVTLTGGVIIEDGFKMLDSYTEITDYSSTVKLVNETLSILAQRVCFQNLIDISIDGLKTLESKFLNQTASPEEDEHQYWSRVFFLGCLAAEVIKKGNTGTWEISDQGTIPFIFKTTYNGEEAAVNPLGKAIKFFENGEEDSLAYLAHMLISKP